MSRYINCIIVEFKLLFRNIINLIPILILFILLLVGVFSYSDPYYIFTSSQFITQVVIIAAMLIGYNSQVKDSKIEVIDTFNTIFDCIKIKLVSRIISLTIFLTVVNILFYLIAIIKFMLVGVAFEFYIEGIYYVILYWYMPSLVALFIGSTVGIFFKNSFTNVLLIVISFLIGPMNQAIFVAIGVVNIIDIRKFIVELNIGQYANYVMDPLYGFEIEGSRFLHAGIFLLSIIAIFLAFTTFKYFIHKKLMITLISSLTIVVIILIIQYQKPSFVYKNGHYEDISKNRYDTNYYIDMKEMPSKYEGFYIKSCELEILDKSLLSVKYKAKLCVQKDLNSLEYILYRDLNVSNIRINGNKKAEFKQNGDKLQINYKVASGDEIDIEIDYEGFSSPNYYYSKKAIMFTNTFAWFPRPGNSPAMFFNNELKTTYCMDIKPVQYKLKFKSDENIYTNLEKKSYGIYEGCTTKGIMLISGMLNASSYVKAKVIYPISCYDFKKNIVKNMNNFYKIYDEIDKMFGLSEADKTKTVIVGSFPAQESYLVDNVMLFHVDIFGGLQTLTNSSIVENIVFTQVDCINYQLQDDQIKKLYLSSVAYWYGKIYNVETRGLPEVFLRNEENPNEEKEYKRISKKLEEFIKLSSEKEVRKVVLNWKEQLQGSKKMNIYDLEKLIGK